MAVTRRGFLGLVLGSGAAVVGGAACVLAPGHRDASGDGVALNNVAHPNWPPDEVEYEEDVLIGGFGAGPDYARDDKATYLDFDTHDCTYVARYIYQTDIGCDMASLWPPVA